MLSGELTAEVRFKLGTILICMFFLLTPVLHQLMHIRWKRNLEVGICFGTSSSFSGDMEEHRHSLMHLLCLMITGRSKTGDPMGE